MNSAEPIYQAARALESIMLTVEDLEQLIDVFDDVGVMNKSFAEHQPKLRALAAAIATLAIEAWSSFEGSLVPDLRDSGVSCDDERYALEVALVHLRCSARLLCVALSQHDAIPGDEFVDILDGARFAVESAIGQALKAGQAVDRALLEALSAQRQPAPPEDPGSSQVVGTLVGALFSPAAKVKRKATAKAEAAPA